MYAVDDIARLKLYGVELVHVSKNRKDTEVIVATSKNLYPVYIDSESLQDDHWIVQTRGVP